MRPLLALILPGGSVLIALWVIWRMRDDLALWRAMARDAMNGHDIRDIERKETSNE